MANLKIHLLTWIMSELLFVNITCAYEYVLRWGKMMSNTAKAEIEMFQSIRIL